MKEIKKLLLASIILFFWSNLFSQIGNVNANLGLSNSSTFCSDDLRFLDKNEEVVDHIQIARWDNSFELSFTGVVFLKPNFNEIDEERFYLEVEDENVTETQSSIIVLLESFDRGDNSFNFPIDNQINVELKRVGSSSVFRSEPRLLVTDNDVFDDKFDSPLADLDGTDDLGTNSNGDDDPTLFAVVGGKIRLTFNDKIKLIDVCDKVPNEKRVVHINPIRMKNKEANGTYWSDPQIMTQLEILERAWGQCCIRFVNTNGDPITVSDIKLMDHPQLGVNLDNGLQVVGDDPFDINPLIEQEVSPEQIALLAGVSSSIGVNDKNINTIDIVFLKSFNFLGIEAPSIYGLAIPEEITSNTTLHNSVFISTYAILNGFHTTPHEVGHILTNGGHYGTDPPNALTKINLMARGTLESDSEVTTGKRLNFNQCRLVKEPELSTNLPKIDNN